MPDQPSKFLAVDERWLDDTACIRRRIHPPRIHPQPVMVADRPWEARGVLLYGTVHREASDDGFRMWYLAVDSDGHCRVCYATSTNGVDWEKPELGLCEFTQAKRRGSQFVHELADSRANNIVFDPPGKTDGANIIFDPDDPESPYKMVLHLTVDGGEALWGAVSRDGLAWKMQADPIGRGFSDRQHAMAFRDNDEIVVLCRAPEMFATYAERAVYRMTSRDFQSWSPPELVFKSNLADPPYMEYYSMTGFPWETVYLGILERMHVEPDVVDCELVISHDGRKWQHLPPRTTFLPRGPQGTWYSDWMSASSNPPIPYQGVLWWFLSGRTGCHDTTPPLNLRAIGVATSRIDGFASLAATECPGWIRTRPLTWPDGELAINADARRSMTMDPRFVSGRIRVEILDEQGRPVAGLTRDDCEPFTQDTKGGSEVISWRGDKRLAEMAGRAISFVFLLESANLYAFEAVV